MANLITNENSANAQRLLQMYHQLAKELPRKEDEHAANARRLLQMYDQISKQLASGNLQKQPPQPDEKDEKSSTA